MRIITIYEKPSTPISFKSVSIFTPIALYKSITITIVIIKNITHIIRECFFKILGICLYIDMKAQGINGNTIENTDCIFVKSFSSVL